MPNGCVLIPVENHGSLSSHLEPGDCVGTVAPIDSTLLQQGCIPDNSIIVARYPEDINPIPDQKVIKDGNAGKSKAQHAQVHKVSCPLTERVQELFEVLALEQGTLTDDQFSSLKKLNTKHADV